MRTCRTTPVAPFANISVDRKGFTPELRTRQVSEKEKAMTHSPIIRRGRNRNESLPALEQNKSRHAVKRDG